MGLSLLWTRRNDFRRDLHKGTVEKASGTVRLNVKPRTKVRVDYIVSVDGQTFFVKENYAGIH